MPDWSAQRRFPRYTIRLPVLYTTSTPCLEEAAVGWTLDLSEGGACLELDERLKPQTPLHLRLQTDRGSIELQARAVWSGEPTLPGGIFHGVAFTWIAPDHLHTLRDLLGSVHPEPLDGVRMGLDVAVTCCCTGLGVPLIQGRTGDISRDGLLLLLPEGVSPGTPLEVTLHTPPEPLTIRGKIVWVEPPEMWTPGEPVAHGFRFGWLGGSAALAVALLLQRLMKTPRRSSAPAGTPPSR
jgi:PilZ domain